jgi:glycerol uptake facilitator protein
VTSTPTLPARCFAEVLGTFLLVFFGCGAVHAAVLTDAQSGLWQVAIVWGVVIMVAVYTIGAISGAHINPAITAAMTMWRGFPIRDAAAYIVSQVLGAFLAAAVLYGLFAPHLAAREKELVLTRGQPGSELTAMCYGEYFPSPGTWEKTWRDTESVPAETLVPMSAAFLAEVIGTLILALVVFACTDAANTGRPPPGTAPVFIGLTVAILISVIAPLTQACFNPARDFGPRLFAYFAGWGDIAIPGPGGGLPFLTVYIVAPTLGAILGGGLYTRMLHPDHAGLEASA